MSEDRTPEPFEDSVRAVLAGNGGTMGAVAEGLRQMGLGASHR